MALIQATAPAIAPVSLAEVKAFLRIDEAIEDTEIQRMLDAALAMADGADGGLGRALITQSWTLKLDAFQAEIPIPLPPLQSVTSIQYIDGAGVSQTVDAADYQVVGAGDAAPAWVKPAYGKSWPSTRDQPEAVTIAFTAGYGGASDVPAPIRQAIEQAAADLYTFRGLTDLMPGIPARMMTALAAYRVWAF